MIKKHLKEKAAEATIKFWNLDLSPGEDSGDLSLRDSETGYVYICPRPTQTLCIPDWRVMKPEYVVVVDQDGRLVEENGYFPTVELPMHLAIYHARPETMAIVHSHAVWSSAFSIVGKNIPLTLAEQSIHLGGEIVCAEYGRVGSKLLGDHIVKALGKHKMAALMRNHGAVVLGQDIDQALRLAAFLEKGAKTVIMGSILGPVIEITPDTIVDESIRDIIDCS